jgi:hypothetical protein
MNPHIPFAKQHELAAPLYQNLIRTAATAMTQVSTLGRNNHGLLLLLSLFVLRPPATEMHQLMILTAPSSTAPYFPVTSQSFIYVCCLANDICFFHLKHDDVPTTKANEFDI